MAMTAKFLADWTSFYDAVDKADVKIVSFQDGARNAESQLNRMVDNFTGRKVVQEAMVMAEAVERAGGASKLTADDLERVSRVAGQAAERMKAMGQDVPPAIQILANAAGEARVAHEKMLDSVGQAGGRMEGLRAGATGAGASLGGLSTTYRQFDGVLQAAGINIGPQVKGLEDIAAAAGGGAGKIGMLGSAGLVLGTGMAAWGITRAAMEFLGLDKSVESAWRQLLQFGDVAAETAGAKADVIARAIANGAKETINYTEAIKFNVEASRRNADAKIDWTAKLVEAQKQVRGLTDAQIAEIEIAQKAGATTEQLSNKYGVNALALKELAQQQKLAADSAEALRKAQEALVKNFDDARSNAMKRMHAQEAADMEATMRRRIANEEGIRRMESEAHQASMRETSERQAAEAAAEAARIAANQAEIDAVLAAGKAHTEAGALAKAGTDQTIAGYQGIAQQVTITGDAVKEWLNLMRYTAQANAILQTGSSLFTTRSQLEAVANIPKFASGVENFAGGLAYVHKDEALVNMPKGTSVIPGGRGSGGVNLSVHLTVQGNIISTFEEFKALAAEGVREAIISLGFPVAAGA